MIASAGRITRELNLLPSSLFMTNGRVCLKASAELGTREDGLEDPLAGQETPCLPRPLGDLHPPRCGLLHPPPLPLGSGLRRDNDGAGPLVRLPLPLLRRDYFVAIFFNTALITCVHALLQGHETSIRDGLSNAVRHIVPILAWAIVAATVGVILRAIQNRVGFIGKIAVAIVGGIWSLVTIFVVPVLVLEDKGVIEATKESVALFRKTWGESVVGSISIGVIFGAIIMVGLLGVFGALAVGSTAVIILAIALFIILFAVVSVVASAMQGIFVTALYTYAKTGTVPAGFGKGVIENAFVPSSRPSGREISESILLLPGKPFRVLLPGGAMTTAILPSALCIGDMQAPIHLSPDIRC